MKKALLFLLLITPFTSFSHSFEGHWKGAYLIDGSGWPFRLHIAPNDDEITAHLDLPNLVFAEEEVPARVNGDTLFVEFPFGLGTVGFTTSEKLLVAVNGVTTVLKRDDAPPYSVEPISWENEGATLHGSLYLPNKPGPHPLLIRLHGAVTSHRGVWEYRSWGNYFARQGIATIVFDRRGSGESTFPIENNDFELLVDDVETLLQLVEKRDDIDTSKIIINGGSQASYIAFMLAAQNSSVDYLLLSSASSQTIVEQERASLLYSMVQNNESKVNIDAALGYQNLYFHNVMTGKNWDALDAAARIAQEAEWGKYVDQPLKESDLDWWRSNFHVYLPDHILPKVQVPTLLLFGANDPICAPDVMLPKFERYLPEATVVICPNAGHPLEVSFGRDRWGQVIWPQKAPEMFAAIEDWLAKYILPKS